MTLFPHIPAKSLLRFTLAYTAIAVTALLLSGCTACPGRECPAFPTSAPRQ